MKTLNPFTGARFALQAALAIFLFANSSRGFAADTFKFTESFRQKLLCGHHTFVRICDIGEVQTFRIDAKFAWPNAGSSANISATTLFHLSFGELILSFAPGDDPNWMPGKHAATMRFTYENDQGRLVHDGKAVLRWNARGFTLHVSSPSEYSVGPHLVDDDRDSNPGHLALRANLMLGFGDFDLHQSVDLSGEVKLRRERLANATAFLHSVTLRGTISPETPPD